jgi:predicted esterase
MNQPDFILTRVLFTLILAASSFLTCRVIAEDKNWQPEDIEFVANCDQTTQKYVRVLPANYSQDEKYQLLIALHGHGSDRWQFINSPRDECRSARDTAKKNRMIFISPDYRAKTSWMGPKAEADVLQIIKENKKKFQIDKTILSGGSMGGTSSLTFTILHPDLIDGVVSMNGMANHLEYKNFQSAIQQSFGGTKAEFFEQYKKRSAEYWPEKFTMPVAFTTGGKDTIVSPESVQRLVPLIQIINPDVLLIHRESTGHSTNYQDAITAFEYVMQRIK